jgi:hypothetical protein
VLERRTWCRELVFFLSGLDIVISSVRFLVVYDCTTLDGVHGQTTILDSLMLLWRFGGSFMAGLYAGIGAVKPTNQRSAVTSSAKTLEWRKIA